MLTMGYKEEIQALSSISSFSLILTFPLRLSMAGGFDDLTVIVAKRPRSVDFNLISFEEKNSQSALVMYWQNISKFCLKYIG